MFVLFKIIFTEDGHFVWPKNLIKWLKLDKVVFGFFCSSLMNILIYKMKEKVEEKRKAKEFYV